MPINADVRRIIEGLPSKRSVGRKYADLQGQIADRSTPCGADQGCNFLLPCSTADRYADRVGGRSTRTVCRHGGPVSPAMSRSLFLFAARLDIGPLSYLVHTQEKKHCLCLTTQKDLPSWSSVALARPALRREAYSGAGDLGRDARTARAPSFRAIGRGPSVLGRRICGDLGQTFLVQDGDLRAADPDHVGELQLTELSAHVGP